MREIRELTVRRNEELKRAYQQRLVGNSYLGVAKKKHARDAGRREGCVNAFSIDAAADYNVRLAGKFDSKRQGSIMPEDMVSEYTTVAKVGEIPEGQGEAFAVNGRMVAVFNIAGNYEAIDDLCPHMGASLAGGYVEDGEVTCPWHAWRFKVCDGTWCDNPKVKVDSFAVRIVDDEIQVKVPPREMTQQAP